jgi:hypothetical protein
MGERLIIVSGIAMCVFVVAFLAVRSAKRHERAKQALRWEMWESIQAHRLAVPGSELAEVQVVCQRARHGTKAVIKWLSTGRQQDTWFAGSRPELGCVVLLRGSTGWGPHNQNPQVFFVRQDQLLALLPAATRIALRRQHQRETK